MTVCVFRLAVDSKHCNRKLAVRSSRVVHGNSDKRSYLLKACVVRNDISFSARCYLRHDFGFSRYRNPADDVVRNRQFSQGRKSFALRRFGFKNKLSRFAVDPIERDGVSKENLFDDCQHLLKKIVELGLCFLPTVSCCALFIVDKIRGGISNNFFRPLGRLFESDLSLKLFGIYCWRSLRSEGIVFPFDSLLSRLALNRDRSALFASLLLLTVEFP